MDVTPGSWTLHFLTPHPLDSPWSSFLTQRKHEGNWKYIYWVYKKGLELQMSRWRSYEWAGGEACLLPPHRPCRMHWCQRAWEQNAALLLGPLNPQGALLGVSHAGNSRAVNAKWWYSHKTQPLTGLCPQTTLLEAQQEGMLVKCNFLLS